MKKTYIAPNTEIIRILSERMIAASKLGRSNDEITDPDAILSRRRRRDNDWEDDWEDEEDY